MYCIRFALTLTCVEVRMRFGIKNKKLCFYFVLRSAFTNFAGKNKSIFDFMERVIKTIIRGAWCLLGLAIVGAAVAFTAIWFGWIGYMPDIDDLQNPISRYATQVYSSDGQILGTRFYNHSGIDFKALARAIVKRGVMRRENAGGGSTITQQLAKQLYSATAHSSLERMLQKPIEWVIAVKLERYYTKEEIIALYLNYFDFLYNAVGIKTAAATYFGKEPSDLSVTEAATLIGLCKNPSLYNPVRYKERSTERRNVVLSQMEKAGYLTAAERDAYAKEEMQLHFRKVDHKDGAAPYFREFLRLYMMAERPEADKYPEWNHRQFVLDSIAWDTDPLYGWCNKNFRKDGKQYNLYTDGLKIFTTIDSRMQKYAEEAVFDHVAKNLQPTFNRENRHKPNAPFTEYLTQKEVQNILKRSIRQSERYRVMHEAGYSEEDIDKAFHTKTEKTIFSYNGDVDTIMTPVDSIRYIKSFLRSGFMSMDPKDGHVKAYVGGLNFTHFMYDMVTAGRRQVGSTIKPFLYSLAMENGFSPCDVAPNVQQTYMVAGKPWTPRNSSRSRYGEMVTLKWGLAQSNNWISAYLMSRLSPQQFVGMLHNFGINNPEIVPSMSLCLGPCDVSVAEMVSAYTTFVNNGIRMSPMFVTHIEDGDGNTIATFSPRAGEVISAESAYKMLVLLQGVVDGGTASRIRNMYNIEGEVGGKTGTTNGNSDAWYIGITPQLVSGAWVGGEDRDIHFDSMKMGQGAVMALPIWANYMKKVYADKTLAYDKNASFGIPEEFDPCAKSGEMEDNFGVEEIFE